MISTELNDVLESGKHRGFVGTVELNGIDLSDRNADLAERFAERAGSEARANRAFWAEL